MNRIKNLKNRLKQLFNFEKSQKEKEEAKKK
jgi:hypothetical protein